MMGTIFSSSFKFKDTLFSNQIKDIIKHNGVVVIKCLKSNNIITCTNNNKANTKYKIGSIAKIITTTALLEEKILTPEEVIPCNGQEIIKNKKLYCWNPDGHGILNITSALSESCNLFFRKASQRISSEDILKYYPKYNLPINPDIQIHDKKLALGLDEQIKFSPLELLSIIDILVHQKTDITKETLKIINKGIQLSGKTGTAKLLHSNGFEVAIKTGTAPYRNKNFNHGWAIGYAPIQNPTISFSIHIDNGTGYSNAVPMALKVLKACKDHNLI